MQVVQSSKVTLGQLRQEFGLVSTQDPQFFTEWLVPPTELSDAERQRLERICINFKYLLEEPPVLEDAVKLVVLAHLLDLAELYQPPYRIRPELSVEIESPGDDGLIVRGNLDVLVVSERLWVLVIESKMTTFALNVAMPQLLSYMLASPNSPCFGLLTNGIDFAFLKVLTGDPPQFAVSRTFSLYSPGNELGDVLKILRRLSQQIAS